LSRFIKFQDAASPETFLQQPEGEVKVSNLDADGKRKNFLPLLMKGKASYYAETPRTMANWNAMRFSFIQEFTVDLNIIIGKVRAQIC
jgi:hypothetical protein